MILPLCPGLGTCDVDRAGLHPELGAYGCLVSKKLPDAAPKARQALIHGVDIVADNGSSSFSIKVSVVVYDV